MNDIQEIKASVNIVDVIGRQIGLKQVKAGEYKGLCCFHADTKASMTVSEKKQIFHCFVCEEGGAIFKANTTGGGFSFDVKSAFCFTSVNEQLEMQSDKNRFSVLSLDRQIEQKQFEKFEKEYEEFMSEERVATLIAKTF